MTDFSEAQQSIQARILELLESGPVPVDDLAQAVAISPDERTQVDRWRTEVRSVADVMVANGEIVHDTEAEPKPVLHLPET